MIELIDAFPYIVGTALAVCDITLAYAIYKDIESTSYKQKET